MRGVIAFSAALLLLPTGCAMAPIATPSPSPASAIRYVALGDSYTIGTSVSVPERFPNQLVERLKDTVPLELIDNLGVNGFTSGELIGLELPQLEDLDPEFVTLLIGVNDVVRRVPEQQYRENVRYILDALLEHVPAERIVVVSTPDYTRSPRGSDFGQPDIQRAAIARFNEIMESEAGARGISFVDISEVADRAGAEPALVARDQLHPSGEQYSRWVDLIAPVVADRSGATP